MLATALRSSSLMSCFLQTLNTTNWKVKMLFSPLKVYSAGFNDPYKGYPSQSSPMTHWKCLQRPCFLPDVLIFFLFWRLWASTRKMVDCWVSFPGCRILSLCLGGSPTQSVGRRAVTISNYCKKIPHNDTAQINILQYAENCYLLWQ